MKTKRILTASTAALIGAAAVCAPAFAAGVDIEYDEDGINIGGGVLAFIDYGDGDKFSDYTLSASAETLTGVTDEDGVKMVDPDNDPVIKDLSKSLKKEFTKVKLANVEVYKIDLAKGIYSEDNAPASIKITIPSVSFDAKVYHVSGDGVKAVKASTRPLSAGGYEVSFTTRNFSSFILTSADLKNADSSTTSNTSSNTSSTSSATSSTAQAATSPNTGVALALAPVLLAATAVSVVALKKKK